MKHLLHIGKWLHVINLHCKHFALIFFQNSRRNNSVFLFPTEIYNTYGHKGFVTHQTVHLETCL